MINCSLLNFFIQVDETPGTGLMYWIEEAESKVRTGSLVELIETTENLYYVTYSRIIIELSAVELSACFKADSRLPQAGQHSVKLPDANHLYRILVSCRDVLDSPALCTDRNEAIVTRFQEAYVRFLICKHSHRGRFQDNDILGFRRYAVSVAANQSNRYHRKWASVIDIFSEIPPQTLTLLAECYFNTVPSAWPARDIPTEDLPFVNLAMLDVYTWDKEMAANHRTAALAQLEGKCVGDLRRDQQPTRLMNLARHGQCICKSVCHCATHCTRHVEESCPCAERQLRMQIALSRRRSGRFDFKTRVDSVIMCGFEGLAVLKRRIRDAKLMDELYDLFKMVSMEIIKERSPSGTVDWSDHPDFR